MELCVVKHKVKTNNRNSNTKKFDSYDTEDSRTKENHCCFEVCASCLSSTMESARLYMWQNPVGGLEDGARGRVEGDYEGVHNCEIDI